MMREKLIKAIDRAATILHDSFGKSAEEVASAAGEARRILREAVPAIVKCGACDHPNRLEERTGDDLCKDVIACHERINDQDERSA